MPVLFGATVAWASAWGKHGVCPCASCKYLGKSILAMLGNRPESRRSFGEALQSPKMFWCCRARHFCAGSHSVLEVFFLSTVLFKSTLIGEMG